MSGFVGAAPSTLIERYTADGTVGTKTFSAIPGTYAALLIYMVTRTSEAATASATFLQFNGDTTAANYDYQYFASNVNTTPTSAESIDSANGLYVGVSAGNTAPAGDVGVTTAVFPRYADATWNKTGLSQSCFRTTSVTGGLSVRQAGLWYTSTAAITSARFYLSTGNFSRTVRGGSDRPATA
jgi:hypothetical protein